MARIGGIFEARGHAVLTRTLTFLACALHFACADSVTQDRAVAAEVSSVNQPIDDIARESAAYTTTFGELAADEDPLDKIMANMTCDGPTMKLGEETIIDFTTDDPVVSAFGTVQKYTVLNYLDIHGYQAVTYGEDGAFATECETHASQPDFGPTHPNCAILHGEIHDSTVMCFSSDLSVPVATAQVWPGVETAMSTNVGMTCWKNCSKQESVKFFTY